MLFKKNTCSLSGVYTVDKTTTDSGVLKLRRSLKTPEPRRFSGRRDDVKSGKRLGAKKPIKFFNIFLWRGWNKKIEKNIFFIWKGLSSWSGIIKIFAVVINSVRSKLARLRDSTSSLAYYTGE